MLRKSLKRRFTAYLAVPMFLAAVLLLVACVFFAHEEIQEVYDTQLTQTAEVAASMLQHDLDLTKGKEIEGAFATGKYEYKKYVALRVWKNGRLLFSTAQVGPLAAHPFPTGFSDQFQKNEEYRVFALEDAAAGLHVEALQNKRVRWDIVEKIIGSILSPILLFICSIPLLLWFGLKFGLWPLDLLSAQVARRSANALEPIPAKHLPEEILPLVNALNGLLEKLQHSIDVERQFTNLAAHELRTPLAVIQTELDAVMREPDEAVRQQGLKNLSKSVNRAAHMIGQLLSLARLGSTHIPFERIALDAIAREVATDLSPLALKKKLTLSFESSAALFIHGNAEVLELALRNLIDNAIKYTPNGGSINIALDAEGGLNRFTIIDSGPGIAPEHLPQVMERFYRVPGNRTIGSGLGLSLVQRAAEIMKGAVHLQPCRDRSGLIVTLEFPPA